MNIKDGIRSVGMLTQEGTSKGHEPTVQVFEIARNRQRKNDDLLPYLAPFASKFRPMPSREDDMILKTAYIPLNDIECLTRTSIDKPDTVQNFKKRKREHCDLIIAEVMAG